MLINESSNEVSFKSASVDGSLAKVFPGLTKPTLISPVIDLALNKNYKNNVIVPYYTAKSMYKDSLINSNTRVSSVAIAKTINEMYRATTPSTDRYDSIVSPITIDYLITNYFVGFAAYGVDVAEANYAINPKLSKENFKEVV